MISRTLARLLLFDVFGTAVDWRSSYPLPRSRSFEYVADDFEDLARQLGV